MMFGGAFIGLAMAALMRRSRSSVKSRAVVAVIAAIVLLVFLRDVNVLAKSPMVERAREAVVPTWETDAAEMAERAGTVFLTASRDFCSFYPVYSFLNHNEHYGHPCSRFKQRLDFLVALESVDDPWIFNIALRHNKFDRVDYLLPRRIGKSLEFFVRLSNYPNGHRPQVIRFAADIVNDSSVFACEQGRNLYRVIDIDERILQGERGVSLPTARESGARLLMWDWTQSALTPEGRTLVETYCGGPLVLVDIPDSGSNSGSFGGKLKMVAVQTAAFEDSICVAFDLEVLVPLANSYRIFFHLYPDESQGEFDNFDFSAPSDSRDWRVGDRVSCLVILPAKYSGCGFHMGLFEGGGRLGEGVRGKLHDYTVAGS